MDMKKEIERLTAENDTIKRDLMLSAKRNAELKERVDQLREQARQASIIDKNINSLRLHHPDPDQTTYEQHVSGECSCE